MTEGQKVLLAIAFVAGCTSLVLHLVRWIGR